jgi:hypothetical protein
MITKQLIVRLSKVWVLLVLYGLSVLFFLDSRAALGQTIGAKADDAMRRIYPSAKTISGVSITIDSVVTAKVYARCEQVLRGKVAVRLAKDASGNILGYGLIDEVRGKSQPITYITIIAPNGSIAEIEILVYREPYGGEVQYETFRKQFRGKRAASDLRVGRDIQNIAGATISSRAITTGTKKMLIVFEELKREKAL